MKRLPLWICLVLMAVCTEYFPSEAAEYLQRIEIHSSPNPVGSGARALGMGGAFIAIADDATAASWNPAGLLKLKLPEISIVGAAVHRIEDNAFGTSPDSSGDQKISKTGFNYISASYPFHWLNRNMVVSINYQKLYDFTREWEFQHSGESKGVRIHQTVDFGQGGNLYAIGLAYGIQATPQLSFGVTLNIWNDWIFRNRWEEKTHQKGSGSFAGNEFTFETCSFSRYSLEGINFNIGLLWRSFNDRFSFGAVFKSPLHADIHHEHDSFSIQPGFGESGNVSYLTEEKLKMPLSYGIGAAYRITDDFTISADLYRTEWSRFLRKDSDGNETSPVTGLSPDESGIRPTHQVRIGGEYLIIRSNYEIPVCAGVFYDPAPAQGSPDDYFGFSIGSGFRFRQFHFDMAYQYRFGNDVGSTILKEWDFSQDVHEHTVYGSVIVHF